MTAATIANNSRKLMSKARNSGGHGTENHSDWKVAPKPKHEASVNSVKEQEVCGGDCIMAEPFQEGKNQSTI